MKDSNSNNSSKKTIKDQQLAQFTVDNDGKGLTTNQGLRVSEDEHSLKAGFAGRPLWRISTSGRR